MTAGGARAEEMTGAGTPESGSSVISPTFHTFFVDGSSENG